MIEKKQKIILIVEDESTHLKVLMERLLNEGFDVLGAKNGKEGLKMALAERPDLILLDVVMPVMDGMTMMKKLRESGEWGKNVPVILLTNLSANNEIKNTMKETGEHLVDFITKADLTLSQIVEKIKERLSI